MFRIVMTLATAALLFAGCGADATSESTSEAVAASDDPTTSTTIPATTTTAPAETSTTTTSAPATTTSPPSTTSEPGQASGGPTYGQFDEALPGQLLDSGYDGPFFMINLLDFREQAAYVDGRETDLTGREANDLYGDTGVQVLVDGGMRPAVQGDVDADAQAPTTPGWDQIAIARYPNYQQFFALSGDPEFQAGAEHKDAGVATSSAIVTHRVVDAPPAGELPASERPVVLFELYSHDGVGTTDRPTAMSDYLTSMNEQIDARGGVPLGTYEVQGVIIGDGRTWDEAHLWWFPDRIDLDELLADRQVRSLTAARGEWMVDGYRLVLDDIRVEPNGREP